MATLTLDDFERDQQEVIEKTDIQQLSGYCLELQGLEDNIQSKEEEIKKLIEYIMLGNNVHDCNAS